MRPAPSTLVLALAFVLTTTARAADPATQPKKLPYTIAKETTGITAPLRADGSPDYLAALNARHNKDVTPENNGYVLFLNVVGTKSIGDDIHDDLLRALGVGPASPEIAVWTSYYEFSEKIPFNHDDHLGEIYDQLRRHPGQAFYLPSAIVYLNLRAPLMTEVEEAAARPRWWIPCIATGSGSLLEMHLPALGSFRDVEDALTNRAVLRGATGDFEGFLSDVTAAKQLAAKVTSGQSLIENLVGVAMNSLTNDAIATVATGGALSVRQIVRLRERLAALDPIFPVFDSIDISERWCQLDIVERIATGDQKTLTELEPDLGPVDAIDRDQVDWDFVLKNMNGHMDELVAAMKEPSFDRRTARLKAFQDALHEWGVQAAPVANNPQLLKRQGDETRQSYSERIAQFALALLMPNLDKAAELHDRSAMGDDMLMVLLAAAEFNAKTGGWPAKSDALIPGYIKSIPKDMYNDQSLHYVLTAHGPRIYSVGPNQKDDGGYSRGQGPTKSDDIGLGAEVTDPAIP